jgi:hypothetical protein
VPYDANISPVQNLFEQPDNLDPQPEYPVRTELTFYKEVLQEPLTLEILEGDVMEQKEESAGSPGTMTTTTSPFPSALLLLTLWVFGLIAWCAVFKGPASSKKKRPRRAPAARNFKDV